MIQRGGLYPPPWYGPLGQGFENLNKNEGFQHIHFCGCNRSNVPDTPLAYACIYMHMQPYTCIYMHMHAHACIYMQMHAFAYACSICMHMLAYAPPGPRKWISQA